MFDVQNGPFAVWVARTEERGFTARYTIPAHSPGEAHAQLPWLGPDGDAVLEFGWSADAVVFNVEPMTPSPSEVGRNQSCPCGRGLKYKRCHLDQSGKSDVPTTDVMYAPVVSEFFSVLKRFAGRFDEGWREEEVSRIKAAEKKPKTTRETRTSSRGHHPFAWLLRKAESLSESGSEQLDADHMRLYELAMEGEQPDPLAAVMATDAFPPSVFNTNLPLNWTPTLDLTVHIRNPHTDGWLKCRFAPGM
ncbi:MAG: SEC-C metal-binding domain-containing protein [Acidimicrobiia bacterium]